MKKLRTSLFLILLFGTQVALAQKRCAMPATRPVSDVELDQLLFQKRKINNPQLRTAITGVIRIPVVVHVIHNNSSGTIGGANNSNISNEQIFSQIKVLNEDYRREAGTPGFNTNPLGADLEIEFYLATVDPDGNPTSGITRHFNARRQWDILREVEQVASISSWDSNRFLNIWVLELGATFLGYAEFPGAAVDGLDLTDPNELIDGVYIDHNFFGNQTGTAIDGPYTFGRTATHEIGHWLGLIHIWGDSRCGNDFCADTPTVESENLNISCDPSFTRCTGVRQRAMIENYMDYSADECMNIFTQDQKSRIRAVLELSQRRRRLVLNSLSLLPPSENLQVKLLSHPNTKENLKMQVLLPGFQDFDVKFYDILGRVADEKSYLDYPSTVVNFEEFSRLKGGQLYIMKVSSQGETLTFRVALF